MSTVKLLTVRYRVLTLRSPGAGTNGVSSRIREIKSDCRLIVAATMTAKNGRKEVYVAESNLIEELQKHCGGRLFVDGHDYAITEAERPSYYIADF